MPELARKATKLGIQGLEIFEQLTLSLPVINVPPSKVTYPDPAAGDPDLNNRGQSFKATTE